MGDQTFRVSKQKARVLEPGMLVSLDENNELVSCVNDPDQDNVGMVIEVHHDAESNGKIATIRTSDGWLRHATLNNLPIPPVDDWDYKFTDQIKPDLSGVKDSIVYNGAMNLDRRKDKFWQDIRSNPNSDTVDALVESRKGMIQNPRQVGKINMIEEAIERHDHGDRVITLDPAKLNVIGTPYGKEDKFRDVMMGMVGEEKSFSFKKALDQVRKPDRLPDIPSWGTGLPSSFELQAAPIDNNSILTVIKKRIKRLLDRPKNFYCQYCSDEYSTAKMEAIECSDCHRFVCKDCFDFTADAGVNSCPYCNADRL